jgi:hypothetical protein
MFEICLYKEARMQVRILKLHFSGVAVAEIASTHVHVAEVKIIEGHEAEFEVWQLDGFTGRMVEDVQQLIISNLVLCLLPDLLEPL